MTTVGITGHQRLPREDDWAWVASQIKASVNQLSPPFKGISSLAIGADQLFAEAVLEAGGSITAVIPFDSYADTFKGSDRLNYQRLRGLSSTVETLPRIGSDEECYMAAGRRVVDLADVLLAVWNGKQAAGLGGTGDVVQYAITKNKLVIHINPTDQTVSEKQVK